MSSIDHIEYEGNTYDFSDTAAREEISKISSRISADIDRLTERIATEESRAVNAELDLERSKVQKEEGKVLSSNDFTDEYRDSIQKTVNEMQGADEYADGASGYVPQPHAGDQIAFLCGDGSWKVPHDTTYGVVTDESNGLMTIAQKQKLDNIDNYLDDMKSSTTAFNGNQITTSIQGGKTKTVTFNNDGSITEVIRQGAVIIATFTTTFGEDGSITRERG